MFSYSTAYLLALDYTLGQMLISDSVITGTTVTCLVSKNGRTAKLSYPLNTEFDYDSLLLACSIRGLPYTTLEEFQAFLSLKKFLAEHICNPTLTSLGSDNYSLKWKIGQELFDCTINEVIPSKLKDIHAVQTGIYFLEEGYKVKEVIGEGIYVISPRGYHQFITGNACNCREYLYDTQKQPCRHINIAHAYLSKGTSNVYTILRTRS